jgi:hypothetical protein
LLVLLGILLISYYFGFNSIQQSATLPILEFSAILIIIIVFMPCFLFYNLYDKVKSVQYVMLPVSQAEKVTFAIIQTGILIPALLVIVF